ncbi:prepilin-type N-terminal cleavage/methylation domain-containing protein [Opitutaceae bacterium TAV1]|nr:prepilin-type N-terminal cleavage/methylation domain-containing protein [Opitutaceae bacterium TAV1]
MNTPAPRFQVSAHSRRAFILVELLIPRSCELAFAATRSRHRAFTLIELLTVIAIIGILAAIIIPVTGKVRDSAKAARSLSNIKQISQAMLLFADDNRGKLPTLHVAWANLWTKQMESYLPKAYKQPEFSVNGQQSVMSPLLVDPLVADGKHGTQSDYGVNNLVVVPGDPEQGAGMPLTQIPSPSQTVLLVTARAANNDGGSWYIESAAYISDPATNVQADDRGRGNMLAAFVDGHAASIPKVKFEERRKELLEINP